MDLFASRVAVIDLTTGAICHPSIGGGGGCKSDCILLTRASLSSRVTLSAAQPVITAVAL